MPDGATGLDTSAKAYKGSLADEEAVICETLVREIGRAQRWSAVVEGFNALLHVRRTAHSMHVEARKFQDADSAEQEAREDEHRAMYD